MKTLHVIPEKEVQLAALLRNISACWKNIFGKGEAFHGLLSFYDLNITDFWGTHLKNEGEWNPLVEGRVWGVSSGRGHRVFSGQNCVEDAPDIALELWPDVKGGMDPAVVVHHLGTNTTGSLKMKKIWRTIQSQIAPFHWPISNGARVVFFPSR